MTKSIVLLWFALTLIGCGSSSDGQPKSAYEPTTGGSVATSTCPQVTDTNGQVYEVCTGLEVAAEYCPAMVVVSYQICQSALYCSDNNACVKQTASGTGGSGSTGGASATGGSTSTGGSSATGGSSETGGSSALPTGGSSSTGGSSAISFPAGCDESYCSSGNMFGILMPNNATTTACNDKVSNDLSACNAACKALPCVSVCDSQETQCDTDIQSCACLNSNNTNCIPLGPCRNPSYSTKDCEANAAKCLKPCNGSCLSDCETAYLAESQACYPLFQACLNACAPDAGIVI